MVSKYCISNLFGIGAKVHGSNPAKVDGFLRVIEVCNTTLFRREVKPGVLHGMFTGCKRTFHS
jgi:hypothetical protein